MNFLSNRSLIGVLVLVLLTSCSSKQSELYSFDRVIGKEGNAAGELRQPIGIAIDQEGFIYVSDAGNHRIQKFSSEGKFIKEWGSRGAGKRELNRPMHISFGPDGNLYVAEYLNDRIQVFDQEGKFIRFIGLKSTGESYFNAPGGCCCRPRRFYLCG